MPPHAGGFVIWLRGLVGLPWTSDQPVAKASSYTGQHNTEAETNIHASSGIRTHDPSNQAAKTYALDRAATGTGSTRTLQVLIFISEHFPAHREIRDTQTSLGTQTTAVWDMEPCSFAAMSHGSLLTLMEAAGSSQILAISYTTTQSRNQEDHNVACVRFPWRRDVSTIT
jgi:hypothetical protein